MGMAVGVGQAALPPSAGLPVPILASPPVPQLVEIISGQLPGHVLCSPCSFWWSLAGTSPRLSLSV